ncbi:MAG: hypothetical protein HETSPECPRED_010535 [Heterodermia speciosa]|uniref:Probable beta-glucosidase E n=1 Tax=Heterodermia speciosa TaxID=116794 RepID=A0A8H3G918_9LECA|nr:MAG: hypothetical protein HETSPECPRED_010535 [Heterodermia speciosa]
MSAHEDNEHSRQGLLKENSIPLRPSVDQTSRSSSDLDDEFNELQFDQDRETRFRNGRRWPWVAKFRRIISGEGPSYQGERRAVHRPSRSSKIRGCLYRRRICLAITGILVAGFIILASGGALWVYKTAPEDGQSPPWYPAPLGGSVSQWEKSYQKAQAMVERMTLIDKVNVTSGTGWSQDLCVGNTAPANTVGFPALCLQDGPLGLRFVDHSTAFPAGVTVGATWNKELMYRRGKAHGTEAKGKGVNVLLGPSMGPFGRMPAGGRNWEGFGPDPVLQGIAAAQTIKGIQDVGVMATAKHFIANEQEHFRQSFEWGLPNAISSNIDDRTLHELYLWPFAESVRAGVASVMCSYNMVNNSYACGNSKLMNGILKDELGFQGFIQSDWLAQRSGVASALAGLDMTMPGDGLGWMDGKSLFGSELTKAVLNTSVPMERINDMVTRVVAAWYQLRQDNTTDWPPPPPNGTGGPNFSSWTEDKIGRVHQGSDDSSTAVVNQFVKVQDDHGKIARQVAAEGTVLVKNDGNILPLSRKGGTPSSGNKKYNIGIYGSDAALNPKGLNVCPDRSCNGGTLASGWGSGAVEFPYLISPVQALTSSFSNKSVTLSSVPIDTIPTRTAPLAPSAKPENQDLCLAFAGSIAGEGFESWDGIRGDRNDLHLDNHGDALIANIADSCNGPVIVVVHAVGPVILDDWISHPKIRAVLLANLPGEESGNALADVLFGDVDASGRLPYTVGKSLEDYGPGGQVLYYPNGVIPQQDFDEGLLVDYRYFDAKNITPRYPFGYGLSYTTFTFSNLTLTSLAPRTPLPAPRPDTLPPPTYPTTLPDPKQALFPKPFRKLKRRVYPYLNSLRSIRKATYPYPVGYHTAQNLSQAGGAEGGNPDLYTPLLSINVTVSNTGSRTGKAVVQLYVGMPTGVVDGVTGERISFPPRLLRAFEKVEVEKGGSRVVEMRLGRKDLSYWSVGAQNWVLPEGAIEIVVGASSRDEGVREVWGG